MKKPLTYWVLLVRVLPPVAFVIPLYTLFTKWNLMGTRLPIILSCMLANIPLVIWFMVSFFEELPEEVEESGKVDGATEWQLFTRLVLLLVLGMIYNPYTDELFSAQKGKGSYCNGQKIEVSMAACWLPTLQWSAPCSFSVISRAVIDFAFFSRNICLPIEALAGFILMGCTPAKNLQSKYRKAHGPYPDHPYPC